MNAPVQRELVGYDPRWSTIQSIGGLWVIDAATDMSVVRSEAAAGRIRAIESHRPDLEALSDLPLEYLTVASPSVDVSALSSMTSLRGLALDSWTGELDLEPLVHLESFSALEVDKGQLDRLWATGHAGLTSLSIGKYREGDLTPLALVPQLTDLAISDSRAVTSLDGIEKLVALARFEIASCPQLTDLGPLGTMASLQSVIIERCNKVTNIAPLAAAVNLRALQIELRKIPSVQPLADHPSLEFLWPIEGKPPAAEIDEVLTSPGLRMVNVGRSSWMRPNDEWLHLSDIYTADAEQLEVHSRLMHDFNVVKYGRVSQR